MGAKKPTHPPQKLACDRCGNMSQGRWCELCDGKRPTSPPPPPKRKGK